jgi:signal transduction histidine kinase
MVISDTGIGMKPDLVKQAMQPFRQLDARLERSFEGMGLGLPLANALLRLHGGHLTIESGLGEGTKVGVKFPADRTILATKASAA